MSLAFFYNFSQIILQQYKSELLLYIKKCGYVDCYADYITAFFLSKKIKY